jgi:hypothetical protein
MKDTLLELVQNILASLGDDEVNSINDTASALQVANIVKETYFELLSGLDLPEHYDFIELDASSPTTPTLMTLPSNVLNLNWVKYDNQTADDDGPVYVEVPFQDLDSFLTMMHSLDTANDTVFSYQTLTDNNVLLDVLGSNDAFPTRYTCFDDHTILFDAYNLEFDANLVSDKILAYGLIAPTFTLDDDFTPDLDAKQFALLRSEAKAQAFIEIEKKPNDKAERRARKGWIRSQRDKRAVPFPNPTWNALPNYGRKRP